MDDAERIVDEAIKRERQKREGLTPSSSRNGSASKPLLVIDPGNLPVVATQLRDALAQSGALYNRGAPVRITASSSDAVPIASPLTAHSVVRLAHDYTRPVKDGEAATLPDRVANMYLDMHGEWNLPKLAGISATPLLSPDGQIQLTDGYHAASGIYCHHMPPVVVPDIRRANRPSPRWQRSERHSAHSPSPTADGSMTKPLASRWWFPISRLDTMKAHS